VALDLLHLTFGDSEAGQFDAAQDHTQEVIEFVGNGRSHDALLGKFFKIEKTLLTFFLVSDVVNGHDQARFYFGFAADGIEPDAHVVYSLPVIEFGHLILDKSMLIADAYHLQPIGPAREHVVGENTFDGKVISQLRGGTIVDKSVEKAEARGVDLTQLEFPVEHINALFDTVEYLQVPGVKVLDLVK